MKNKFLTLFTSALGVLCLSSCGTDQNFKSIIESTQIDGGTYSGLNYFAIPKANFNLRAGETAEIKVDTFPSKYSKEELVFESVNPDVATVDSTGKIEAVSNGITKILVKSNDNAVKQSVIVSVSDLVIGTELESIVTTIENEYKDASYVAPTKLHRVEYDHEEYIFDGVLDHGGSYYEEFVIDNDEGYFMITSDDIDIKTKNGAKEKSSGKWIFYVIDDMNTRMVHITKTAKRYFDLNTAAYIGQDYYRVIYDILNMFFVSGESIVTDMMDDYIGSTNLKNVRSYLTSKDETCYKISDNQLYAEIDSNWPNETVSAVDELVSSIEIPTGTKANVDQRLYLVFDGAKCPSYYVEVSYKYEIENQQRVRNFSKGAVCDEDVYYEKIEGDPKDLGYSLVDSVFDL